MSEVKPVHRYKAQTLFSFGGAKIEYFPHGPEVVLATEFDAQRLRADTAEAELARVCGDEWRKDKRKLAAAEQRIAELEKDAARWNFFSTIANELQVFPHSWGKMTPEKMNHMCDEAMAAALNPNPEEESQ